MFRMIPVSSSSIAAIGHDPKTSALHVQFKNGGVWSYAGVPAALHAEMLKAQSVGSHFHQNVRGKFQATKA